jgi:hypothetical protein
VTDDKPPPPPKNTTIQPPAGSLSVQGTSNLRSEGQQESGLVHHVMGVKEHEAAAAAARAVAEQEKREVATPSRLARQAILRTITEFGHEPKALPQGVWAAVRDRLVPEFTHDVFNNAWKGLVRDGVISPSP